ncbi:MAG: zinc-ribbon domain-containing protein [Candidatus Jordarchaeaceae archaeon]
MANNKVNAVISGNYGPNAFNALKSLGIQVYTGPVGATVREAIEEYISGHLAEISTATGPAHMGMGRGMGMRRCGGLGRGFGVPVSPVVEGARYCPYCGAQTVPGARFCSQCGKPLE